jgi:putative molybdopterin biosynthesis protein
VSNFPAIARGYTTSLVRDKLIDIVKNYFSVSKTMEYLRTIQDFEQLKILADPRRLAILRLLMVDSATLSQLGQALGEHPARVRHHLKLLERAGLVELVDQRVVRGFVEKYYRARARAFSLQQIVLPASAEAGALVILGSHDLALDALASEIRQAHPASPDVFTLPVGSLEGLVALRQGLAQIAGCHLLDNESGEYNLPYVRHLFPDREIALITLVHREQGLLVAPGNPHKIHHLEDLFHPDVRIINRNRGSGTRLWLDHELNRLSLPVQTLHGYEREARTHVAVAEAVNTGRADAGLGVEAAARKYNLDFIPLFQERFDLVMSREQVTDQHLRPLFDILSSLRFRRIVEALGGYQTDHTGDQILP